MTQAKEWHENTANTALCAIDNADEEAFDSEEMIVDEWGDENPEGWVIPPHAGEGN